MTPSDILHNCIISVTLSSNHLQRPYSTMLKFLFILIKNKSYHDANSLSFTSEEKEVDTERSKAS